MMMEDGGGRKEEQTDKEWKYLCVLPARAIARHQRLTTSGQEQTGCIATAVIEDLS